MPNDDPTVGTGWGPGEPDREKFLQGMRGIDSKFGSSGSIPVTKTTTDKGTRYVRNDNNGGDSDGSGCGSVAAIVGAVMIAAGVIGAKYGFAV